MPDKLTKAKLVEMQPDFKKEKDGGKQVTVQFNPDSLKVSFSNQLITEGQKGTSGQLHVGAGVTKLTLQLWFDLMRLDGRTANDVRDLTSEVTYFITPKEEEGSKEKQLIPPALQFQWGTFSFDGVVDSLDETLDYWSADGKPLRATMNLSMSQQKITALESRAAGAANEKLIDGLLGQGGRQTGTTPLAQVRVGATLQGMVDLAGGKDWQSVAAANGIENPRVLPTGQLVNLNPVT
jgi:hypothetical protein